ncbi:O-antigen ligase family protein [Clostridium saccharobutylicum]|uniref:O-antigen ligase n=1 Tax=Clostridium saccharobutylicum TaxID=169679 RepID=A0A1S8NAM2_CLOSA|nr:O-antigen ligase family protein [Clostridium saccharobutylicum]OOM13517.1 O-antigen ligase [Clostridium saccharobutylicum]
MKEIIENIYKFIDNKFYFKLLYLFVSLIFVTILKDVPGLINLKDLALAWGIILILLMIIQDYKKRKIYKFDIPLALFMGITLIFTIFVYKNGDDIKMWIFNLILFMGIFTIDVFRNKKALIKEMNIITHFYVIFMFFASIESLVLRFSGEAIQIGQIAFGGTKGIFENENALSIASSIAIVMCIYLYNVSNRHKLKIFWMFNIILQLVTMIGSHGRSAYLLVVAVLYTFIFVYNKNKHLRVILTMVPFVLAILIGLACYNNSNERVRDFTSGRTSLWTSASIVIKEHPLTGVGKGEFLESVRNARETDDLPGLEAGGLHDIYIQTATLNGVVSLLLLLSFFGMVLNFIIKRLDNLIRKEKLQMSTLTSMVIGILAVNLFESTLIYVVSFISMIFWIYLGYLISILDNKNIE